MLVLVENFIECFHSRGQHLGKFIGAKESVCIRNEFNSHRIGLPLAAVSLFWETNVAAVTSCENTLLEDDLSVDTMCCLFYFVFVLYPF